MLLALQGEQREADELRRLQLRLERANEHVNQLQSRLASQESSGQASCSDQLAEAQRAQQAQQLEIETLRRQLSSSQAGSSSSSSRGSLSSREGESEVQRAQQQLQIQSQASDLNGCSDKDQQLGDLKEQVAQLQAALAKATAEGLPAQAISAELAQVDGAALSDITKADGSRQAASVQLDLLSPLDWSLDSAPTQWCQLAVQDSAAFCHRLGLLLQDSRQQRAELAAQSAEFAQQRATAAEQRETIAEQAQRLTQQTGRLSQASSELADKAAALESCSQEVSTLQGQLADSKSVTNLQSDQLAVLQAEVNQLRGSLAAAEKVAAGSGIPVEQLQLEMADLKGQLQVRSMCIFQLPLCACHHMKASFSKQQSVSLC